MNPNKMTPAQVSVVAEIQAGYEARIATQKASINRLLVQNGIFERACERIARDVPGRDPVGIARAALASAQAAARATPTTEGSTTPQAATEETPPHV